MKSARWMLALVAAAELLGMSLWFTARAPRLQAEWGLCGQQTAALTSAVQFGFVAGTLLAAVLNLADPIPGAMVTEVAPPHAVGTALTLQTSVGFLLTAVTNHACPNWPMPGAGAGPSHCWRSVRWWVSKPHAHFCVRGDGNR